MSLYVVTHKDSNHLAAKKVILRPSGHAETGPIEITILNSPALDTLCAYNAPVEVTFAEPA